MTAPSPTTAKTEPEPVKVPAHVLESLSSADIAELVALWNAGGMSRDIALQIAAASGAEFDARHAPLRCPICQRFTPCPKHPESTNGA
jgi:hypothetical protein